MNRQSIIMPYGGTGILFDRIPRKKKKRILWVKFFSFDENKIKIIVRTDLHGHRMKKTKPVNLDLKFKKPEYLKRELKSDRKFTDQSKEYIDHFGRSTEEANRKLFENVSIMDEVTWK